MKKISIILVAISCSLFSIAQQGVYNYSLPTVTTGGDTIENSYIKNYIKTDTAIYCSMGNPPGLGIWIGQDFEYRLLSEIKPEETTYAEKIFAYDNKVYLVGAYNIYEFSNNTFDSISYPTEDFVMYSHYRNAFFDDGVFYLSDDSLLYLNAGNVWKSYLTQVSQELTS